MNDIDSNMAAQAICFAAQRIAERWCETADALLEKIQTPCPSCASKDARIKELEDDYRNRTGQYIRACNEITELKDRIAKLEKVAEAAVREVPDKCTCDDAYKSRGLQDPDCLYCDMVELRAALATLKEG